MLSTNLCKGNFIDSKVKRGKVETYYRVSEGVEPSV